MKIHLFDKDQQAEALPAGTPVFREGDTGNDMFAVLEGTVDLIVRGQIVETVETGGVFGEMALIEERPRAVVIAEGDRQRVLDRILDVAPGIRSPSPPQKQFGNRFGGGVAKSHPRMHQ